MSTINEVIKQNEENPIICQILTTEGYKEVYEHDIINFITMVFTKANYINPALIAHLVLEVESNIENILDNDLLLCENDCPEYDNENYVSIETAIYVAFTIYNNSALLDIYFRFITTNSSISDIEEDRILLVCKTYGEETGQMMYDQAILHEAGEIVNYENIHAIYTNKELLPEVLKLVNPEEVRVCVYNENMEFDSADNLDMIDAMELYSNQDTDDIDEPREYGPVYLITDEDKSEVLITSNILLENILKMVQIAEYGDIIPLDKIEEMSNAAMYYCSEINRVNGIDKYTGTGLNAFILNILFASKDEDYINVAIKNMVLLHTKEQRNDNEEWICVVKSIDIGTIYPVYFTSVFNTIDELFKQFEDNKTIHQIYISDTNLVSDIKSKYGDIKVIHVNEHIEFTEI